MKREYVWRHQKMNNKHIINFSNVYFHNDCLLHELECLIGGTWEFINWTTPSLKLLHCQRLYLSWITLVGFYVIQQTEFLLELNNYYKCINCNKIASISVISIAITLALSIPTMYKIISWAPRCLFQLWSPQISYFTYR